MVGFRKRAYQDLIMLNTTREILNSWEEFSEIFFTPIKVGDIVRVKPGIAVPVYAWGGASRRSAGRVTLIYGSDNNPNVKVDFPEHIGWTGKLKEMERVTE
jgi:hypothetical protein